MLIAVGWSLINYLTRALRADVGSSNFTFLFFTTENVFVLALCLMFSELISYCKEQNRHGKLDGCICIFGISSTLDVLTIFACEQASKVYLVPPTNYASRVTTNPSNYN